MKAPPLVALAGETVGLSHRRETQGARWDRLPGVFGGAQLHIELAVDAEREFPFLLVGVSSGADTPLLR